VGVKLSISPCLFNEWAGIYIYSHADWLKLSRRSKYVPGDAVTRSVIDQLNGSTNQRAGILGLVKHNRRYSRYDYRGQSRRSAVTPPCAL